MPMAGPRAMGTRENFGLSVAQTSKSSEKSRKNIKILERIAQKHQTPRKNRALRAPKPTGSTTDIVISPMTRKVKTTPQ